jgi:hypothetical protein
MKRMALSDAEAEVIRGMRIERNIYNQAVQDVLTAITLLGENCENYDAICEAILALRKE